MRRFILLLILLLPNMVMATQPEFDALSRRYTNIEGITVTNIDNNMLTLMASSYTDASTLEFIDNILVLISQDKKHGNDIIKRSSKIIKKLKLEPYLSVNDDSTMINIYCVKDGEIVTDLVVQLQDGENGGVVVISGNIPDDMINRIVQM
jgi:hypothetical protein